MYKIKYQKCSQEEYVLEKFEKNGKIYYKDNYDIIYCINDDGIMDIIGVGSFDDIGDIGDIEDIED